MDSLPSYKQCPNCHRYQFATDDYFYPSQTTPDNLSDSCIECETRIQQYLVSDIAKPRYSSEDNRARAMKYLARRKRAGADYTGDDIRMQMKMQTDSKGRLICWWCDKPIEGKYQVDHRIPLDKGGSNSARNIVIVHIKCNLSKGAKLPHEWNGRLL